MLRSSPGDWEGARPHKTDFDGGKFSDIIRGYQAFGMVAQGDMPDQASFNPKRSATPQRSTIATGKAFPRFRFVFIKQWNNDKELEATKAALRSGRPVATGIWWLNHFENRDGEPGAGSEGISAQCQQEQQRCEESDVRRPLD
jgi:hypothetical protein